MYQVCKSFFSSQKWAKNTHRRWAKPCVGVSDELWFLYKWPMRSMSQTHLQHAYHRCHTLAGWLTVIHPEQSCSVICIGKHAMRAALSPGVGCSVHTCAQCTCMRSVTHTNMPWWLGSQKQMRHNHEQTLVQCLMLLSVSFWRRTCHKAWRF